MRRCADISNGRSIINSSCPGCIQPATLIAGTPSPGIEPSQTASGGTSDSGITPSPTQKHETEILIQLMGDVLLHDTTTLRGGLQPDGTYDFNSYLDIISQSINGDLTIANIESPVDANGDGSAIQAIRASTCPAQLSQPSKTPE